jgi:transcriptional regulator with XRE-family HTH domain
MAGKRHTREDIAAKLRRADEMAAKGETQQDISRALGISIMTYHRWKKDREDLLPAEPLAAREPVAAPTVADAWRLGGLSDLQIENERLRRLVTDLLLEKIALQEQLEGRSEGLKHYRT